MPTAVMIAIDVQLMIILIHTLHHPHVINEVIGKGGAGAVNLGRAIARCL